MSFASRRKRLLSLSWLRRPPEAAHLRLGRRGERLAARFLKRRHHHILARNFRCAAGEIDLICAHENALVFVEVKTRAHTEDTDPEPSIHPQQWRRIERAARYFLRHSAAADRAARFDVITIAWPERGRPQIEHYPDAYQPGHS